MICKHCKFKMKCIFTRQVFGWLRHRIYRCQFCEDYVESAEVRMDKLESHEIAGVRDEVKKSGVARIGLLKRLKGKAGAVPPAVSG